MSNADRTKPPRASKEVEDFHARGEREWAEYLRTGLATSVVALGERIDALVAERRAQLSTNQSHEQN